jgi:hypothetical protein
MNVQRNVRRRALCQNSPNSPNPDTTAQNSTALNWINRKAESRSAEIMGKEHKSWPVLRGTKLDRPDLLCLQLKADRILIAAVTRAEDN